MIPDTAGEKLAVGQFERNLNHIGHSTHKMKHIVYVFPIPALLAGRAIGTMCLLFLWFKKHLKESEFQIR